MIDTALLLDIRPNDWDIVRDILQRHVPDREVLAFGSRATWTAKEYSDLDLAILGGKPLSLNVSAALAEAFSESNLPFQVDVVDWVSIDESFRTIIRRDGLTVQSRAVGPGEIDAARQSSGPISEWDIMEIEELLPKSWTRRTLGDFVETHTEKIAPYSLPSRLFAHHSIPAFDDGKNPTVEPGVGIKSNKFTVPFDAVLVSRLNPRFPRVWSPVVSDEIPAICSTEFLVMRPQSIYRRFLHYLCMNPRFRELLLKRVTGTSGSHQRVPPKSVLEIEVSVPPLAEQRVIADFLGALDDKIELNRRMNETLEAMARAIFKDWFVDFGPTRAKAEGRTPYLAPEIWSLFPDALDDEGKPVGWQFRPVSMFAKIRGGKQLSKDHFVEDGPVPVFGGAGLMGYTENSNASGYVISVGRVGAYCGQFFSHRGPAWINNNASLILPFGNVSGEWLLLALRALNIDLIKKGAAQPFVSNSDISAMDIVYPGEVLLRAFQVQILDLVLRQEENQRQSVTLAQTRDRLLPKLISGEIRVAGAGKAVEAVA